MSVSICNSIRIHKDVRVESLRRRIWSHGERTHICWLIHHFRRLAALYMPTTTQSGRCSVRRVCRSMELETLSDVSSSTSPTGMSAFSTSMLVKPRRNGNNSRPPVLTTNRSQCVTQSCRCCVQPRVHRWRSAAWLHA